MKLKLLLLGFGLTAMLTTAAVGLLAAADKHMEQTAR